MCCGVQESPKAKIQKKHPIRRAHLVINSFLRGLGLGLGLLDHGLVGLLDHGLVGLGLVGLDPVGLGLGLGLVGSGLGLCLWLVFRL